jgi:hypothetical protein
LVPEVTNVYNLYHSNQQNVTKITYVNQRVNHGVIAVSRDLRRTSRRKSSVSSHARQSRGSRKIGLDRRAQAKASL